MRDIWFTSDFHFGHFNIIRYCNRPFANVQLMDDAITDGVNACVKPNDVLYFLGDFCLGRAEQVIAYRKRLACRTIHFIEGNHDKVTRTQQHRFATWSVLSEINVAKQKIVLCHYAMRVCPRHAQGAWHLYGHSHGKLPDDARSLSIDVGVDAHAFRPWHFDELQSVMRARIAARESSALTAPGTTVGEDGRGGRATVELETDESPDR